MLLLLSTCQQVERAMLGGLHTHMSSFLSLAITTGLAAMDLPLIPDATLGYLRSGALRYILLDVCTGIHVRDFCAHIVGWWRECRE